MSFFLCVLFCLFLRLGDFEEDSFGDRSLPPLERKPHLHDEPPRPQRRERTKFNRVQSIELEREFHKNPYPGIQRRVELACKLAIDESRIQVRMIWFYLVFYLWCWTLSNTAIALSCLKPLRSSNNDVKSIYI